MLGYIFRIIYAEENTLGPYIVETIFILIAPIFYAASIYSLLGKLIIYVGAESMIPIKPSKITCIFLSSDILALIMQVTGGGMQSSASNQGDASTLKTGGDIVVIGLAIQLTFFFFFLVLTGIFTDVLETKFKSRIRETGNFC